MPPSPVRRRQARRLRQNDVDRRWGDVVIAILATLGVIAAIYFYYRHLPQDRSLVVEATTQSVQAEFYSDAVWRVWNATVCREAQVMTRQAKQDAGAPSDTSGPCGTGSLVTEAPLRIAWESGAEVELERVGSERPTIRVEYANGSVARNGDAVVSLKDGDTILLPQDFEPLRFNARVRLGGPETGGPILISGMYEWRERLSWRERPQIIGAGTLMGGDIVRVGTEECGDEEEMEETVLLYPSPPDVPGLTAVVSAVQGESDSDEPNEPIGMCLGRSGFETTFIEPRLSDRILLDPFTYALGLFLTAAITIYPATLGAVDTVRQITRRNEDNDHPDEIEDETDDKRKRSGTGPSGLPPEKWSFLK